MQRYGQTHSRQTDKLEEYKAYHANVWPEILAMIRECNIHNYSIYYKDGYLFAYFGVRRQRLCGRHGQMAADPKTQEWWAVMMPMQDRCPPAAAGEWWATMEEVFHTD